MKNIADVNSDDILTELNNLDYDDEDLKLLDDEDIKPISTKQADEDLSSFYMDYSDSKVEVDLYTEKPKEEVKVEEVKKASPKVEKKASKTEPPLPKVEPIVLPSVDDYLNRPTATKVETKVEEPKHVSKEIPNPLINTVKQNIEDKPQPVKPVVAPPKLSVENNQSEIKDLTQLFDKVSSNVKGASEIVNRNAEIKKKIDERFEELRRLQQEHEANKQSDYQEINSYKEEVYSKLQQKKADIERDLIDLRNGQDKLAADRKSFEEYKNTAMANLKALEKELKDSYESRNKNIEQVEIGLVRRKEQLDIERTNIAKEKEQIEKDRATLAENLLQFNKLVDDFTNGINSFN